VPLTVKDQFTPTNGFVVSFCKLALNEMFPAFAFTLLTLFLIVTTIGGLVIVKVVESDFVLSCAEVAASMTLPDGTTAGGL